MSKILRDARSRDETIVMEKRIYITLPREEDHSFHLTGKVRLVFIKQITAAVKYFNNNYTGKCSSLERIIKLRICNALYKTVHQHKLNSSYKSLFIDFWTPSTH